MFTTALSRAVIAVSLWTMSCSLGDSNFSNVSDASAEPASHYVRNTGASTVVVFVHGVLGDAEETWVSEGGAWPEMLSQDSVFDKADIFVFQYPTSMWATMSIDELAEHMRLQLAGHAVTPRQNIVFLVHSMGGLVTRAYLLKNRAVAESTKLIYFFSTPTTGSQVARMAGLLSQNPQFTKMQPMDADDYLADLQRNWLGADFDIPTAPTKSARRMDLRS
jgi:triacylglycerol esterase/lipase EstA (alpha/beta hydrolase family)